MLEGLFVGSDRDVGVDQRGAAKAAALQDGDVGEGQEFIEASWIRPIARVLHNFAKLVGELADLPFAPPFQYAHRFFGSGGGDARRGDGSAVAGTDDDEIVMLLSEFPIFG